MNPSGLFVSLALIVVGPICPGGCQKEEVGAAEGFRAQYGPAASLLGEAGACENKKVVGLTTAPRQ